MVPSPRSGRSLLIGAAALAALALAGCGASASAAEKATTSPVAAADPVQATLGELTVSGGYVPEPASPDVAVAYLTVTNHGATADAVTSATSDAGGTTSLHTTEGGSMVPLTRLVVPAHGSAQFTTGAAHLMIENPTRTLAKGDTVAVTLTFAVAGTVTVDLPVTGYRTGSSMSPMPGMS